MVTSADSLAKQLWGALTREDQAAVQRLGRELEVVAPRVQEPTYDFPSPASQASGTESAAGEQLHLVQPDTPGGTVEIWNAEKRVKIGIFSKAEICGARAQETRGSVDFPACALPLLQCTTQGHKKGREEGAKAKKDDAVVMEMPDGERFLAIFVRASSQSVKPRIFSRPIIGFGSIPAHLRDERRLNILTGLELYARAHRALFLAYGGYEWMEQLANQAATPGERADAGLGERLPPPPLEIPSPRMGGPGGYRESEFNERPSGLDSEPDADSLPSGGGRGDRGREPGGDPPSSGDPLSGGSFFFHRRERGEDEARSHGSDSRRASPAFRSWRADWEDQSLGSQGGGASRGAYSHSGDWRPPGQPTAAETVTRLRTENKLLERRIAKLERLDAERSEMVRKSMKGVKDELDKLWAALPDPTPAPPTPPPPPPPAPSMSDIMDKLADDRGFKRRLLESVLKDMERANFITKEDLEEKLRDLAPGVADTRGAGDDSDPSQWSGMSERLTLLENEMFKPEGVIALFTKKFKLAEDRKLHKAVERGGKVFRDQTSVDALVELHKAKKLEQLCMDMFSMLVLTTAPFFTTEQGLLAEAAAYKAEFTSVFEARVAMTYDLVYPDNIIKKSDKKEAAETKGFTWAAPWLTHALFKGEYNDGTKQAMKDALPMIRDTVQNAIDQALPKESFAEFHAVFTDQLLVAYHQADSFVDCLSPLYETYQKGSLAEKEAWLRVQLFIMDIFEDVFSVRHVSAIRSASAHIWGSFQATELLKEYTRNKWISHPHAAARLALTSMQREGRMMAALKKELDKEKDKVATLEVKVGSLEEEMKALRKKNPSLKS